MLFHGRNNKLARGAGRRDPAERIYAAAFSGVDLPSTLPAATVWTLRVSVENKCDWTWLRQHPAGKHVDLTIWIDSRIAVTQPLPNDEVRPGQRVEFCVPLRVPATAGRHEIVVDMIEQNVARFQDRGAIPCKLLVNVTNATPTRGAALQEKADRMCPWNYQPTCGIETARDGAHYPLFVVRSQGCHFWDTENRRYTDYVMGWGSALLGYAEPRVQAAIRDALDTAGLAPLPYALEVEVAERLIEDIPSAERVVFGKNGSDVCTLAARLARTYTGRKVILHSGYHGWQDWWVEQLGFGQCGVPDRATPIIHRFRFNDADDFRRLFELHRHDLAAVMLEPSGPAEGAQGASQDADAPFLKLLAGLAHSVGALLVFDEIMTGFRYPGGSVQRATGVIPDLTCLGKALGGGMPLSALVGNAAIMEAAMHRTHYGPTFKGEMYSLAAARAALDIYRTEPVAAHVREHGLRLRQGLNRLCDELGVDVACVGPPFRSTLVFAGPDDALARRRRTLYFQELLKCGVMTYKGFMLPSYAHGDEAQQFLLEGAGRALECLVRAERSGNLDRAIEIPLL